MPLDGLDRRFHAIDRVRALDVVAEEYLAAAILRAGIELDELSRVEVRQDDEADGERQHREQPERRPAAVMNAPVERLRVAILQARDPALAVYRRRRGESRRHHGNQRLRNDERGDHRDADGNRGVGQPDGQLVARAEQDRQEHHDAGGRAGERGDAHLLDARQRGGLRVFGIHLPMAEHTLGDHHGVVHQHADGQHHAHHRHHVDGEPDEVHHRERHQQRQRHRGADDERGGPVPQEQEQHREGEGGADEPGLGEIAQRTADRLRLVVDGEYADALHLRQRLVVFDDFQHAIDDLDHVGLRGLEHVEPDGGAAVEVAPARDLRAHQLDAGDVAEMHVALDDEVADFVERPEFAKRSHREALAVAGDLAGRHREVALLEQLDELADVHGVRGQPARIDQDAHFARFHPREFDTCHTIESLDRLLEIAIEQVVLRGQVLIGGETHREHGGIGCGGHPHPHAIRGFRQLRAHRVQLVAHLEARGVDVRTPGKADFEARVLIAGRGADFLDAGQRGQRVFDGPRDQLLGLLGCRAGIGHACAHEWKADIGILLERQQARRNDADDRHRGERHERGDGPAQREVGVHHGASLPACAAPAAASPE